MDYIFDLPSNQIFWTHTPRERERKRERERERERESKPKEDTLIIHTKPKPSK